jgi:hypothetical protein
LIATPGLAAKKESAVVVYLAAQPDMQGMIAARELLPGLDAVEILHSSELLPEVGSRILARGLPRAHSCPAGGNPPQLVDSAGRVLDRLIQLDYRGALRIYEHVIRELPCLDAPLAQGVLADLLYYRGMAQLGLDYHKEAKEAFRQTLGMKPDYRGDPNFPPESNAVLEAVRADHRTWPWVRIGAYVDPAGLLRVDGSDWDPISENLDLHPGMHVVQYRRRGRTWTLVIDLKEGDSPFLIHSDDRLAALRAARRSPHAQDWVASLLGLTAGDRDVDLVVVVDLEASPGRLLYFYRSGSGTFSFARGAGPQTSAGRQLSLERQRAARSEGRAGGGGRARRAGVSARASVGLGQSGGAYSDHLRLRFSGGYAYVHPFSYALIPVDASVRIVAGLNIDLGGELGLNRSEEFGLTLLPAGQVGLSYRFDVGDFQPRLGALVRLGADAGLSDDGEARLRFGWAGRVGFDVTPGGGSGLVSLDAQVGLYGKPLFVSVTGGGGFRF